MSRNIHGIELLEPRRLLTAGAIDTSFGSTGSGAADRPLFAQDSYMGLAARLNGKILVAGENVNGPPDQIAQFDARGALDRSFGSGGIITITGQAIGIENIALTSGGKLLTFGQSAPGIRNTCLITRYLPSGRLDKFFGNDGTVSVPFNGVAYFASAQVYPTDGDILVGGTGAGNSAQLEFFRLTRNGTLDKTFGNGGYVETPLSEFPATGSQLAAVALLKGGGFAAAAENGGAVLLASYTANGRLNASFGANGFVSVAGPYEVPELVPGLAAQPDGKILMVSNDPNTGAVVVNRYLASGSPDPTFGNGGSVSLTSLPPAQAPGGLTYPENDVFYTHAGNILVAGVAPTLIGDESTDYVAELNKNGVPETAYGTGGISQRITTPIAAKEVSVEPNGDVVQYGSNYLAGSDEMVLTQYTKAGQLDPAFGYHGVVVDPLGLSGPINAVGVQPGGDIVAAGSEIGPAVGDPTDAALIRYNDNGTLDTTFGSGGRALIGIGQSATFNSMVIQPNGSIIVSATGNAGFSTAQMGTPVYALYRFKSNGRPDNTFGKRGKILLASPISALTLLTDGDIVTAATIDTASGQTSTIAVSEYSAKGTPVSGFGQQGSVSIATNDQAAQATSIAVQSDGKIVIGGSIGGDFGLASLNTDGTMDTTFGTGGIVLTPITENGAAATSSIASIAIAPGGDIVAGGNPTGSTIAVARYLPGGQLDPAFGTSGIEMPLDPALGFYQLQTVLVQSDGNILVGLSDSDTVAAVIRLNAGGLDSSFGSQGVADLLTAAASNASPEPAIQAMAFDGSDKIVAAAALSEASPALDQPSDIYRVDLT